MLKIRSKTLGAVIAVMCLCSGCAQLLQLPIQLISLAFSLPFKIVNLAAQLVPLASKYAPLALLFVEADNADHSFFYENTDLEKYVIDGFASDQPGLENAACYVLRLNREDTSIGDYLQEKLLTGKARILFVDKECSRDRSLIKGYWNQMRNRNIRSAYLKDDSTLPFNVNDRRC